MIKGVGINNDGGEKASFTAPSIQGQAQAVSMAQSQASVPIETIGYIEAHGTATPIGDPIEVQALNSVFQSQTDKKQFCGLGSVKSNVGHTVAAAGVAGLIKTTLALFHEQIPPTLHYEKANPQIDFEASPFFVCDSLKPWPKSDVKRRAGVSSFGVGGTNAHILLEEAPLAAHSCQSSSSGAKESETIPVQLLPISAKAASSVEDAAQSMAQFFADDATRTKLADHAYTLQTARASFPYRAFAVGADFEEVATAFSKKHPPRFVQGHSDGARREVAFMFPGQGSQYVWMGKNLYDHAPVFRQAMDECCDILTPLLDRDLRSVLYPQDGDDNKAAAILRETRFTQPAIFALGYSLAKLWESWGIHADCYLGHSIGEFVAACMAGVFRLEDGLKMIAERGRLMQSLPGGSMLSVRAEASEVEQYVKGDVAIGSFNGPKLCALAGPDEDIERIRQELDSRDIACKLLHTSHAFHSPMMDPIVEPFQEFVAQFELNSPQKPIMSTVTADWMTDEQATDPGYWANHMRAPVAFSQAIQQLWAADQSRVLLELGPRTTLSTLARQHAQDKKTQRAFASLSDNADENAEWYSILAAVGQLWLLGIEPSWPMASSPDGAVPRKATLPTYCFQRERHFIEPGQLVAPGNRASASLHATPLISKPLTDQTAKRKTVTTTRRDQITFALTSILEKTSGIEATDFDDDCSFLEMGMDSLVLTQAAAAMKKELGINVSFRQMLETTPTVSSLVDFLDAELPAEKFTDVVEEQIVQEQQAIAEQPAAFAGTEFTPATLGQFSGGEGTGVAQAIIQNQLQIMQQQLQVLAGSAPSSAAAPVAVGAVQTPAAIAPKLEPKAATSQSEPKKKTFGAGARVSLSSDKLDANQQAILDKFIEEYVSKTPKSKSNAQRHRKYMADPRTVSGFKPPLKEMTYPIVVEKSKGAYLWDIDGNEYVDVTCGFGSNFVGHTADFMVDAMTEQLKLGYEIGPQTMLAGEVAKLFCELTGAERCAFANTGSEAVLGATRLARTATGRDLIVMFTGDYHGILDEVIVRGNKNGNGLPAATGIPGSHVENTLILEYGTDESLRIIEERLGEVAAIVVETVQSRRPEYQPKEFLQKLRRLTENEETALIFDEVITGFRIAAGGAQEHFGVKADLATYGKIVGGGMPIGMVAGKAKYMDGLDGGFWEFGDDSLPEVGMTYFAGTFVRHPVTMAAAKRILEFIRDEKDEIYDRINGLTNRLAKEVNEIFTAEKLPLFFAHFGSLFKVQFEHELPYGELLFAALRHRGIHIWDHRPCLLTLAHTEADVDEIIAAFREAVTELKSHGFLPTADAGNTPGDESSSRDDSASSICNANAKRGKDKDGKPGWFVPDAANPGQYIQVPAPN